MTKEKINIKDILNTSTLDSRDQAVELFDQLRLFYSQNSEIALDFAGIEFMSRSFADQFHKERMNLIIKKNIYLLLVNTSIQIIEILDAVSKTQHNIRKAFDLPVYTFSKEYEFFQYLHAL